MAESTNKKLKAAIDKAIAGVEEKKKQLNIKLKEAQEVFNGVAKQKLVVANK